MSSSVIIFLTDFITVQLVFLIPVTTYIKRSKVVFVSLISYKQYFFTGETRLSYSLPIYPENAEFDQFTCLPRLLIEFVVNKVPKNFPDYQNMIYLTVESVYNIQNSWKKESNSYSVGTFLPICDKVSFNESHCSSSYRVIRNVKKLVLSVIRGKKLLFF